MKVQGDRLTGEALRRAYEEHQLSLVRLATLLLADQVAAEDLVHDVFLRCRDRLEGLDGHLTYAYLRRSVLELARAPPRDSVFAEDAFWTAWEVCPVETGLVEPFTEERISMENRETTAYVRCMRDRGWDLPDPWPWEGPYHPGLLTPGDFDVPSDPEAADRYYRIRTIVDSRCTASWTATIHSRRRGNGEASRESSQPLAELIVGARARTLNPPPCGGR